MCGNQNKLFPTKFHLFKKLHSPHKHKFPDILRLGTLSVAWITRLKFILAIHYSFHLLVVVYIIYEHM